jgi:hypothetical protein
MTDTSREDELKRIPAQSGRSDLLPGKLRSISTDHTVLPRYRFERQLEAAILPSVHAPACIKVPRVKGAVIRPTVFGHDGSGKRHSPLAHTLLGLPTC